MSRRSAERPPLTELAARIGVEMDQELLERAVTHRSYAYENGGLPTNERLEFLGDRVLGLVVEVQPRRRIFCPMTRVTNIDAGAVVTTGLLNMRRFEQRTNETLVMAELLDKRVTLLETGEPLA